MDHDLRPTERALLGALGLEVCFRDPGIEAFGLRHGLYVVGDRFLEVLAPKQPDTAAGRYLERCGPGGYMVIVEGGDPAEDRARVDAAGIRVAYEAHGPNVTGLHLHPSDVGGAILSIDHPRPPGSWGWAGPDWPYHRTDAVVKDLVAVEIAAIDPPAMAARWGEALGLDPIDTTRIDLGDSELRFEPGTIEGVRRIDLLAADPRRAGDAVQVGTTRLQLV